MASGGWLSGSGCPPSGRLPSTSGAPGKKKDTPAPQGTQSRPRDASGHKDGGQKAPLVHMGHRPQSPPSQSPHSQGLRPPSKGHCLGCVPPPPVQMLCPCSAHPCFQGSPCGPGHHSVLSKGVPLSSSSPPPLLDVPASAPRPRQPEGPRLVRSRPSRMPLWPLTAPAPWPVPSLSPHHMQVPSVRLPRAPSLRHLGESLAACKASLRHQLPDLPASKIYNLPPSPEHPHLPTPTSPTDVLGLLSALRARTYRCGSDVSPVLHREWVRKTQILCPFSWPLGHSQRRPQSRPIDHASKAGAAHPRLPGRARTGRCQAEQQEKLLEKLYPAAPMMPLG